MAGADDAPTQGEPRALLLGRGSLSAQCPELQIRGGREEADGGQGWGGAGGGRSMDKGHRFPFRVWGHLTGGDDAARWIQTH